ncbi:MAG: chemotaxis protein CheW [Chloroflexi bacterium]|nr:chemotaxis protein CheW [Chloroflexota bacterium]
MSTLTDKSERQTGEAKERSTSDEHLVVFSLGEELFGIDIARVQEIIRWQRVTRIPKASYFVEGIINLRGRVIPVVDLRRCFGLEAVSQSDVMRIVVVEIRGSTVGLIVDGVSEVLRLPESVVEPPSPIITTRESTYLRGIARLADRFIALLDLEQVISSELTMGSGRWDGSPASAA